MTEHISDIMPAVLGGYGLTVASLYFDGSCEPQNPGGVASCGWIAFDARGNELHRESKVVCEGEGATNNVAEYHALGRGLRWVRDNLHCFRGCTNLAVYGDSQLVVKQVEGSWKCNKDHLRALRDRCKELIEIIESFGLIVALCWIPRERNELADSLSREAYESHTGKKYPERVR